jgi:hypothetical protein
VMLVRKNWTVVVRPNARTSSNFPWKNKKHFEKEKRIAVRFLGKGDQKNLITSKVKLKLLVVKLKIDAEDLGDIQRY